MHDLAYIRKLNRTPKEPEPISYDQAKRNAIEALRPIARDLLQQGFGHDGAMMAMSEALFETETWQAADYYDGED
jgi:hypothetical protein